MRNGKNMATILTDEERFKEISNSEFDCPICLEKVTNPRCLPCSHTYCEACLKVYIISHVSDTDPVTFSCPSCRQKMEIPQKGIPIEDWASKFPVSSSVIQPMEASVTSQQKNHEEEFCEPCKRGNEVSLALLWCIQCREGLCEMCNKFHRQMKLCDRHEVVKIKEKEQFKFQPLSSSELFCNYHQREILEKYCINHQCSCCKLCMVSEHRFCKNIQTLEEIANDSKLCKENISGELDHIRQQAGSLIEPFVLSVSLLEHNAGSIKEEVSQMVVNAKLNLDKCQLDFNEKLDALKERKITFLKEQIQVVKQFLETVADCQKMLTNSPRNDGEKKKMFLIVKKIRSYLLKNFMQLHAAMNVNNCYVDMEFSLDNTFKKLVKTLKFGEVSLVETPKKVLNVSLLKDIETFPMSLCETPCIEQITIEKILETNRNCSEGVTMEDGTMIFLQGSNTLIVFYVSGLEKFTYNVSYTPLHIAANTAKKRIFVSDAKSYIIRSYFLTDTHLLERNPFNIQEKDTIYGTDVRVATSDDTLICGIHRNSDKKILLLDYDGKLLKELKINFDNICASVSEKQIYYTTASLVINLNFDGQEIFRYFHPDLHRCNGIALDLYENVYVCGLGEGKLHLISKNGKRGKTICVSGLKTNPKWIGFDHTGRNLFISQYEKPIEKYQVNFV